MYPQGGKYKQHSYYSYRRATCRLDRATDSLDLARATVALPAEQRQNPPPYTAPHYPMT